MIPEGDLPRWLRQLLNQYADDPTVVRAIVTAVRRG